MTKKDRDRGEQTKKGGLLRVLCLSRVQPGPDCSLSTFVVCSHGKHLSGDYFCVLSMDAIFLSHLNCFEDF